MLEILNLMVDQGLGNLREKTLSSSFWCDNTSAFIQLQSIMSKVYNVHI